MAINNRYTHASLFMNYELLDFGLLDCVSSASTTHFLFEVAYIYIYILYVYIYQLRSKIKISSGLKMIATCLLEGFS